MTSDEIAIGYGGCFDSLLDCSEHARMTVNDVAVIIVNYCKWIDTVMCVESVLHSDLLPRWIIIVDNASPNDSVERIQGWAAGDGPSSSISEWPELDLQPAPKPIPLLVLHSEYILTEAAIAACKSGVHKILLIRNGINNGYAGGNNIGMALGLQLGAEAFWILNNDTIVHPSTCRAMRDRLMACSRPGLVGGIVRYLTTPDIVQCCCGGYTNRWTLLSTLFGQGLPIQTASSIPRAKIEGEMNFVYGASVMASRKFVETVGYMDERYFLYCEEQDWAWSAANRFDLAYAPDAHVLHKEGESTGLSRRQYSISRLALLCKSRLRLAFKHSPETIPTVLCGISFAAVKLVLRIIGQRVGISRFNAFRQP